MKHRRTWIVMASLALALALVGCAGTNFSVSAGFGHQSLNTVSGGNQSGWGAGASVGMVGRDGETAIELCGNGGIYFGKTELQEDKLVTDLSGIPLQACAELPLVGSN